MAKCIIANLINFGRDFVRFAILPKCRKFQLLMHFGIKYYFWFCVFFILFTDAITKLIVRQMLNVHSSIKIFSFFSVTHVQNKGSLFGLLGSYDANTFFILITTIAVICIFYHTMRSRLSHSEILAWGLVAGGALGNLADRLLYGAVTDFIDFKIWPVFNVADSAITAGIVLLLLAEVYTPAK
ncbi:MAG: signal peptidase II [Candidatus Aenigmarchaeota archaeon]|nr:signal peptidase II [Candidatus Aenigmarchaeota archaeon]